MPEELFETFSTEAFKVEKLHVFVFHALYFSQMKFCFSLIHDQIAKFPFPGFWNGPRSIYEKRYNINTHNFGPDHRMNLSSLPSGWLGLQETFQNMAVMMRFSEHA